MRELYESLGSFTQFFQTCSAPYLHFIPHSRAGHGTPGPDTQPGGKAAPRDPAKMRKFEPESKWDEKMTNAELMDRIVLSVLTDHLKVKGPAPDQK